MATRGYVPESGDVVWLELDPQAGHEQAGPALVISPATGSFPHPSRQAIYLRSARSKVSGGRAVMES